MAKHRPPRTRERPARYTFGTELSHSVHVRCGFPTPHLGCTCTVGLHRGGGHRVVDERLCAALSHFPSRWRGPARRLRRRGPTRLLRSLLLPRLRSGRRGRDRWRLRHGPGSPRLHRCVLLRGRVGPLMTGRILHPLPCCIVQSLRWCWWCVVRPSIGRRLLLSWPRWVTRHGCLFQPRPRLSPPAVCCCSGRRLCRIGFLPLRRLCPCLRVLASPPRWQWRLVERLLQGCIICFRLLGPSEEGLRHQSALLGCDGARLLPSGVLLRGGHPGLRVGELPLHVGGPRAVQAGVLLGRRVGRELIRHRRRTEEQLLLHGQELGREYGLASLRFQLRLRRGWRRIGRLIQRERPKLPREVSHFSCGLRTVARYLLQECPSAPYQSQEWLHGALRRHVVFWLGLPFCRCVGVSRGHGRMFLQRSDSLDCRRVLALQQSERERQQRTEGGFLDQ
eukprot:scaffold7040_cov66-Phaeocystis_antarctica.AAC.10